MKTLIFFACFATGLNAFAQQESLIAHYPLTSTPNDTTGHFAAMTLTNTPFRGGGIYCNGIYKNSGIANGCHAETPILPTSIFQSFSISAKFKVDTLHGSIPVVMGGDGWRWMGCFLAPDTTLTLYYIGQTKTSSLHFSMNQWHEFTMTYDSLNTKAKLYLDGALACSTACTIVHGPAYDRTFSIADFGAGTAYKGFLRDIKIYSRAIIPSGVVSYPDNSKFLVYPNPNNGEFKLEIYTGTMNRIDLEIFNLDGEKIYSKTNLIQNISHGIDLSKFPRGIYFVKIYDGKKVLTKKMVIQ